MADDEVPGWVRLGLVVALALPQLAVGIWAVLDPAGWFADFPGVDPRLVAAEPPYNQHLATDAGAGFLCTGVALGLAALWGRRSGVLVALATLAAFAVPHLTYHAGHPSELLTSGEQALNLGLLGTPLVVAAILAVGTLRRAGSAAVSTAPTPAG